MGDIDGIFEGDKDGFVVGFAVVGGVEGVAVGEKVANSNSIPKCGKNWVSVSMVDPVNKSPSRQVMVENVIRS